MKQVFSICAFAICPYIACAQDSWSEFISSDYVFLGFSTDNKYAVYEMSEDVMHSEPAKSMVQLFVIDVDKNSYATRPFRYAYDSAGEGKYKRLRDSADKAIARRYQITGNFTGSPLLFRQLAAPDSSTMMYSFSVASGSYKLAVKNIPVNRSGQIEETNPMMVQVDLISSTGTKTLQAPEKAPASWGVTDKYWLLSGWSRNNKIALFIVYETDGFEGPGFRHQMIVTGKIE